LSSHVRVIFLLYSWSSKFDSQCIRCSRRWRFKLQLWV